MSASENPLAQMLVGAIFGYAYRTYRQSDRDADFITVEGIGEIPNLPKHVATLVEGILAGGGQVIQRRMGNVVEVLIQNGADQMLRYLVPVDDMDTFVVDTDDAYVDVVDVRDLDPDDDGIIDADFEPV
jgi:hypothetical protein